MVHTNAVGGRVAARLCQSSDQLRCGVLAQALLAVTAVMGIALGDTVTLQGGGWGGEVCEVMRLDEGFNSNGECTAAFRILATNKTYTASIEYATPASADIASNAKATVSKDAAKASDPPCPCPPARATYNRPPSPASPLGPTQRSHLLVFFLSSASRRRVSRSGSVWSTGTCGVLPGGVAPSPPCSPCWSTRSRRA